MTRLAEIKKRLEAAKLAESYGYNKPATIDAHALSRFQARALDDVKWLLCAIEKKRSAEDAAHLAEVKSTVQSAIVEALMPKLLADTINAELLEQNARMREVLEGTRALVATCVAEGFRADGPAPLDALFRNNAAISKALGAEQ